MILMFYLFICNVSQTKINALSEQLQRMFSRAPKKPKDSANQMDEKIG